jgi:hypothetical protein
VTKPTEELIGLLGIEVPTPPTLALAGIKADGFLLHWKPSEQKNQVVRYKLYVNGINRMHSNYRPTLLYSNYSLVGEVSPQDVSIVVSGLQPDHGYVIRILAFNASNFLAASDQISVQTKPATSGDFFLSSQDGETVTGEDTGGPVVKPYKALFDTPSQTTTPVQREHSSSVSQQKRQIPSRRHTQTGNPHADPPPSQPVDTSESEATIRKLTEKLDKLREEKDGLDTQLRSEEEKFQADHDGLTRQLHEVQQHLQDKNNVSRELGRQVANLVGEESSVRKSKIAAEKQLNQALQEREKMKEDMKKWDTDASKIEENISRLAKEQEEYGEKSEQEIHDIKANIVHETAVNKALEEGLRYTVLQIRELEEEKKKIDEASQEQDHNHLGALREIDPQTRLVELQHAYAYLSYQLSQAKMANQTAQHTLDYWKNIVFANPQSYPAAPIDLASPRRNSARRRAPSLGSVRGLQLSSSFDIPSIQSFGGVTLATGSPSLGATAQYFGLSSGVGNTSNLISMSPVDVEGLTGGAPTSPSAVNSLLPSGLLGDDTESRFGDIERPRSHSMQDSPQLTTNLPGLGAPEALEQIIQGPSSPNSLNSRSPSIFTSPRESSTHLPYLQGTNSFGDSDRRSIRSTTGSTRTGSGGGTKFSGLFNLGKAKGKNSSEDGPILGSLKSSESQSFPHNDLLEQSEPVPSSPKRRGSHSGLGFMGQMLSRANTSASLEQPSAAKRRFNVFSIGKNDPWAERTDSPRPSSTASSEIHLLPRPSAETQSRFGWPISGGELSAQRSSRLGADWGLAPPSSGWSSRLHSRNSSSQYALGIDESVDEFEPNSAQAPIGTRPRSAHVANSQNAPRLNPTAPSFKTIFSRSSTDKKQEKKPEKSGKNKKDKSSKQQERESLESEHPRSSSRLSRDAMSVSTVDYSTDDAPRDSLDIQGSSATPSEAGGSASQQQLKESFMQKLSRKSSAGFTTLAGRKGRIKAGKDEIIDNATPDDEMSRSVTSNLSPDDRGAPSPSIAAAARGFKFRSLRRRKAEAEDFEGDVVVEEPKVGKDKDK